MGAPSLAAKHGRHTAKCGVYAAKHARNAAKCGMHAAKHASCKAC